MLVEKIKMQVIESIEFETVIKNEGWLKLPSLYQDWEGKWVKVIVLSSREPNKVSIPTKTNEVEIT
jgi:hypothetical protein